jgi:hypothetical protein
MVIASFDNDKTSRSNEMKTIEETVDDKAVDALCASVAKDVLRGDGLDNDTPPGDRIAIEVHAAVGLALAQLRRVGTDGSWCFICGADGVPIRACGCEFQRHFSCYRKNLCDACIAAHERVGRFLSEMFAHKISMRADSRRARAERILFRAATRVCSDPNEGSDCKRGYSPDICQAVCDCGSTNVREPVRNLRFLLSQTDAFDDSEAEFERKILTAFRDASPRFFKFQELAAAIAQESDDMLFRDLARAVAAATKPEERERRRLKRIIRRQAENDLAHEATVAMHLRDAGRSLEGGQ